MRAPQNSLPLVVLRRLSLLARRVVRAGDDRGDVPGWVLVTLMTAGLVTVLWTLAGTTLQTMFTQAVAGVTGPGAG